ncbi:hypothetical protein [Microbacterium sp.]|uniref:hypothetical protein n=1 Tax=Microbacterium sp. TaxID=51671 RepID=UPI002CD233BC|nr:hypothetical protein [Microbacterium sp.]HWK77746.1 hypothetical protein [Microbacterium sp.]
MPLHGEGLLAIWHRVTPEMDLEYNDWHTREHLPERVGIEGFRTGRRYVDDTAEQPVYLTLYVGRSSDSFASPAYLERLNAPTAWTQRVQPSFRDFVRSAYDVTHSVGLGVGAALGVVTVDLSQETFDHESETALSLLDREGVCGVHCAKNTAVTESYRTAETDLRADSANPAPTALILVEATSRSVVTEAISGYSSSTVLDLAVHIDEGDI